LPDGAGSDERTEQPVTYESKTPLREFPIVALRWPYELELAGMIQLSSWRKSPTLRADRDDNYPFILRGGPLTFSNPVPLAPYVDAVLMGEAEGLVAEVIASSPGRRRRPTRFAGSAISPTCSCPEHHGEHLPSIAQCDDALLPAWGPIDAQHRTVEHVSSSRPNADARGGAPIA